jgi:hypothetical protein
MDAEFTLMTGKAFTVTVATAEAVQPFKSVPSTVYEVVVTGLSVILAAVLPVFQL